MVSPVSVEQILINLKKFKTYLNNHTDQDNEVENLKEHISEASRLLDKSKTKLTAAFNINLPEYPDEDLQQLIFYKEKIIELLEELNSINTENPSLKKKVSDLHKRIDYDIKLRIERGQPKAKERSTDF